MQFTVALVGQPNVGKSVIMNLLTGAGAVVSNYPGTTVEITQGYMEGPSGRITVIDTPGTYSLHSDTEEQRVAQRVLLEAGVDLIVNVADARNLSRNLYLTLQLLDLDIPMVLALNQMDMAREAGMIIDTTALEEKLQIPVTPMIASKGEGLEELEKLIWKAAGSPETLPARATSPMRFSPEIERVIGMLQGQIEQIIPEEEGKHRLHPSRALAIHLMEHDALDEDLFSIYPELAHLVEDLQEKVASKRFQCAGCFRGCWFCPAADDSHPVLPTCLERTRQAQAITTAVVRRCRLEGPVSTRVRLERLLDNPSTGIPILALVAYLAVRLTLEILEFAEEFVPVILEPVVGFIAGLAGSFRQGSLAEIIITAIPEGVLLPFEVVMPTMLSIYLIMALLEDSGLMPRIAVMMDRIMSFLKIPGQSIIPFLLGFGCRAPGVLATRTLPNRESRIVVSTLLAIPIPCAATLGIITGVARAFGADLRVIYGAIAVVFLLLARLVARYLQADSELVMEIPPVRLPSARAVAGKAWMRMESFFKQVLPVLMITGIGVRVLLNTGILSVLSRLDPISTGLFGITGQSLVSVAVTVVQRYAAPMVLLNLPLGAREATIAASMISLSLPCIPVSYLIAREFGWKTLAAIYGLALGITLSTGFVLNLILPAM
ncbi:MAG: ferrous iron transport protein B [Bacillota bacterium]|nr:ferrous iron transport protein B [Candidatus Fermentithermobacillaceae bacterium]